MYGKYFYVLKTKTMTEKEAFNDPEMKTILILSGYARELGEGKDFEETTYKTAETIVKIFSIHNVSPRIIDWKELRNNFFNECTTETPREESGKKVNMAPHDLFEWFKREISEYVG